MEVITGHIREQKENITGEIKEYCTQSPVLVKDSAGATLYTKNPGETATITDNTITNSDGTIIITTKAQENKQLPNITLTEVDGTVTTYPACKNITAKVIMIPKKINTGALVAGVMKTIATGLTFDNYFMELSDANNIAEVDILRPNATNPTTKIDIQSAVDLPGGLTLKIIGFNN